MSNGDELLRRAREARGLTQGELAARAGTSQEQVSRWESGKRSPTVDQLARLLAVLGYELTLQEVPAPERSGDRARDAVRDAVRRGERPRPGDRPSWG
jgi:transcriptional regulator with XRE-family HTH domain